MKTTGMNGWEALFDEMLAQGNREAATGLLLVCAQNNSEVAQCTTFSTGPKLVPAASSRLSRVHNVAPGERRTAASKWASM